LIIGQGFQVVIHWLIPIAAGGFIYIAGTDLVPELHKEHPRVSFEQLFFIILGVIFMIGILFIE
jgi:zinc and cadmium transporter